MSTPEQNIGGLRALAERAIEMAVDHVESGRSPNPARWEAHFNTHGDPFVVEEGRGRFATVATVSTQPVDYGRARALYMAAANPAGMDQPMNRYGNTPASIPTPESHPER